MRGVALDGLAARVVFEHSSVGPYEVDMAISGGDMPDPWIGVPLRHTKMWVRAPYGPELISACVDPATGRTVARWRHFGEDVRVEYDLTLASAPLSPGAWRVHFGPVVVDIDLSRWR